MEGILPKLTLLLDMDGVLTDFDSAAAIAHGLTPEELQNHRKPGEWSIRPAIGRALGLPDQISEISFWHPIAKLGIPFWEDLQPTPWYSDLIKYLLSLDVEMYVVSNPYYETAMEIYSVVGKSRWLKKRFGWEYDRLIPTKHKHLMANHNSILIDDSERNCNEFRKAGGSAILFSSIGNKRHKEAANGYQVARLKAQLDLMIEFRQALEHGTLIN